MLVGSSDVDENCVDCWYPDVRCGALGVGVAYLPDENWFETLLETWCLWYWIVPDGIGCCAEFWYCWC